MWKNRVPGLLIAAIVLSLRLLIAANPVLAASPERVLYSFCTLAGCPDGYDPVGTVTFDTVGNLYGVTYMGGRYGDGAAFELKRVQGKWKEQVLHSFNLSGSDGAFPEGGLILDAFGNLYGTTSCYVYQCGEYGYGNIFELKHKHGKWTEKILHSFNGTDGANPYGRLSFDAAGNLYGTTLNGGAYGQGTAFELMPNNGRWTEKVLHSFDPNDYDGCEPYAGMIFDSTGNLYGSTSIGGTGAECAPFGCGTVFELIPGNGQWTEEVLYSFGQNADDGASPNDLVFDASGNLYGTTSGGGGKYGYGTVFELVLNNGNWTEAVLHRFNRKDGAYPQSGLAFDAAGNLYGTTHEGGAGLAGVAFELRASNAKWTERVLHRFGHGRDASQPSGGLVFDPAGNLYGLSYGGGEAGNGTVFQLAP